MESKKKHKKHNKLNAGGHGGGGHEGGHGEGRGGYGGVIYAEYPYYPYPYPYCLQDEKGQCVNPYPTAESATMRGFFGMNSRNNFKSMKSDMFKADANAINGANPVFNGTHYKKFQNVSNSIGGFPEYLSRVPGASLGEYIKAKGIPGTVFSDFLTQTGITLTPTSSVDEVSDAMNLAQKNLHHSRSKMLKAKLLLLNDFMLSGTNGTFGAYLGAKNITADQFSSGLPDSLNNPAIFNQTAQQIVPYITAANDTYFEQFKKFVNTAPDDIDSQKVFEEFDKPISPTQINASGMYNALGMAVGKTTGGGTSTKTTGSTATVSSVKNATTGTKVNNATNTLANKSGATKVDPNLATNQQIATSTTRATTNGGGTAIKKIIPGGGKISPTVDKPPVNPEVDPNLAINQQIATSQIKSGQVPTPNIVVPIPEVLPPVPYMPTPDMSGGSSGGGGGDDGDEDAPADSTPAPSTDVPIYYGFSIKGVSLKGLVSDINTAGQTLSRDTKQASAEFRKSLHVLNEFDPLMVAVRALVGSCYDVNLFNMSTNFSKVKNLKDQTHWNKATDLWNTIGGQPSALGNMVNRGSSKKAFLSADATVTKLAPTAGTTTTAGVEAVAALVGTPVTAAAAAPAAIAAGGVVGGLTAIIGQALPNIPPAQTPPTPDTTGLSAQNQAAIDSLTNGTAQGNSAGTTVTKKAATTGMSQTTKIIIGSLLGVALIVGIASMLGSKKQVAQA